MLLYRCLLRRSDKQESMVNKNSITNLMVLGGFMCLAPAAFADCPQAAPNTSTACMDLLNPGYTGGFAGVYVGPYTASINGGTPTSVICDDYLDDSYVPEYWTADIYPGSGPLTTTRDAKQANGTATPLLTGQALQQAYDEVGYLAIQLLNTPVSDVNTMGEIHFALWSVFDPTALANLNTATGGNYLYTGAVSKLNDAINVVTGAGGFNNGKGDQGSNYSTYISQFTIYSPDTDHGYSICVGTPSCSVNASPPQEFLVKTPEAPFFALLGVDLSGLGAVIFLLRRRRTSRP